ncbi:MAG: hypothetical protein PQJ58_07205 [Spirochaetales bacterium]|nr:hypothetical protein [Spirochaetales bacterium]
MKKSILFFLLFLVFMLPVTLTAQSNEVLDVFLEQDKADLGTTSWLILASAGKIDEEASVEDALNWIMKADGLGKMEDLSPRRNITYGEFSYILMEVLEEKGGLMYRLVPGPRYAAREAAYNKWLLGRSAPGRSLKPFEVINTIITVLETEGDQS